MKQLLIVNSAKALKTGNADDLTALDAGQIGFFNVNTAVDGHIKFINAKPTENFGIALGKGANMPAFVIPEVDVNTLAVTVAAPKAGAAFSATVTIPTVTAGKNYTVSIVKLGTVPNERSIWSASYTAVTGDTAAIVAGKLRDQINNFAKGGTYSYSQVNVTATVSSAALTVTGLNVGEQYALRLGDDLYTKTLQDTVNSNSTKAEPNIGDTAYIKHLAQQCAAGKGFNLLDQASKDIYPGYPEAVEEIAQADIATKGYTLISLRFATKRDSGKQVDERVWQYVHIAVPTDNASLNTIKAVLGQPVLVNEPAASNG